MGKVRILGGGTDGSYTVEPVYDEAYLAQMQSRLQAEISDAEAQVVQFQQAVDAAQSAINEIGSQIENLITLYTQECQENGYDTPYAKQLKNSMTERQASMMKVVSQREQFRIKLASQQGSATAAQAKLTEINSVSAPGSRQAWCADLTEDASGEKASIEIPCRCCCVCRFDTWPCASASRGELPH